MVSHFPLALSIAAAGPAMASVIQHASTGLTPNCEAWLLIGSTALGLLALAMIVRTLQDYDRLKTVYRPTSAAMLVAAGAALLLGVWRPFPVVLVGALAVSKGSAQECWVVPLTATSPVSGYAPFLSGSHVEVPGFLIDSRFGGVAERVIARHPEAIHGSRLAGRTRLRRGGVLSLFLCNRVG